MHSSTCQFTRWSTSAPCKYLTKFFFVQIHQHVRKLTSFSSLSFATFCRLLLFVLAGLRASRSIFEKLLDVVLEAPMSFFDTTPVGRIINRFSKDLYVSSAHYDVVFNSQCQFPLTQHYKSRYIDG